MTLKERDDLIINNISLAEALAKIRFKFTPHFIQFSELISAAYYGLLHAAETHQKQRSSFVTWATIKINSAMKDYARECFRLSLRFVSLDAQNNEDESLLDSIAIIPATSSFDELIENLNPIGKKLIFMYYVERLTMKEIGQKIGVEQPRVSKMLHYYITKIAA